MSTPCPPLRLYKGRRRSRPRALRYIAQNGKVYAGAGPSHVKKLDKDERPKIKRERPPLYCMEFVILGETKKDKEGIKKMINKMGGKVVTKLHDRAAAPTRARSNALATECSR